jgi:thiol-disulfide isomerase/thioredoxin
MLKRNFFPFLVLILFLVPALSCKKPAEGLPDVEVKDLNGQTIRLSKFAGKPLVVNFWATWCGPCRFEIPMLNELHKKYASSGLILIGISTDDEGAEVVKPFMKEIPIQYGSYLKTNGVEEKFGGILGLPTTFFYDRNGRQIDKVIGMRDKDFFEDRIQELIQ